MSILVRKPIVAGQFYPAGKEALRKLIADMIEKDASKQPALGVVLPHAGYIYSAKVAASVISRLNNYDNYIILGPNHTGYGPSLSVFDGDLWQTPFGEVSINKKLAQEIEASNNNFDFDTLAHQFEHSVEVQIPLLQFTNRKFEVVPIIVATSDLKILKQVGESLAKVIKNEKSCLVIASSDMTHYESQESANKKDELAIDAILKLDEDLLMKRIRENDISMCGYGPVIIMLSCVKKLGAKQAKLIKYQTSAETSGDYSAVVGYAGITVS